MSARLENDMHQELLDRCNKVGCRVNDFVKAAIDFALHNSTEFDFGNEEDEEQEQKVHRRDAEEQETKSSTTVYDSPETTRRRHVIVLE